MQRKYLKIALLAIGIVTIVLGVSVASEYAFGTKVKETDKDIGRPLNNLFSPPFAGATVMMWDIGPNPGFYDRDDVLYLVGSPAPATITANAIRLTPFEDYYPAGSKVKPGDKDMGMPLSAVPGAAPAGGSIAILDLYGTSALKTPLLQQYDLDDPVYWCRAAIVNFATTTNDVRLIEIPDHNPELPPGTKLNDFDPDHFKPVTLLDIWQVLPSPAVSWLKYYDTNGNGIYDYPDDVYLIRPAPWAGGWQVTINSVRLSGPAT
jgi:hypothetical protein